MPWPQVKFEFDLGLQKIYLQPKHINVIFVLIYVKGMHVYWGGPMKFSLEGLYGKKKIREGPNVKKEAY